MVLVVLAGGYYRLKGKEARIVSSDSAPPTGSIWFGSSVDPATLALSGKATSFPVGQRVAMVANLSRETHSEPLTVFVSGEGFNGPVYTSQFDSGLTVFAFVLPGAAFPRAGPATVQIIDDSDKVLATGTLTAL